MQHPFQARQRGQAIFPLVLVLTVVFGLIGVTFAGTSYLQSLLSSQRAFAEQALQATASGIDDALLRIARDKNWVSAGYTIDVDGVIATVTVTESMPGGRTLKTIDSTATFHKVTRSLRVIVEVSSSGGTKILSREEVIS